MGVARLNYFIQHSSSNGLHQRHFKTLSGKKIAIDISIYLYKFQESILPSLSKSLKNLDQEVNIRKENVKLYFELLKDNPNIILPQYEKNNGVLWRFSFLIKGNSQIAISNELRKRGFDISNWYPSTHKMFIPKGEYHPSKFKNSGYLEKHIFNLWVHS